MLLCSALATGAAVAVMPAALMLLGTRMDAFAFPAPRFLARGWDWLVGRGRWVTRWAVMSGAIATAALIALAIPATALETGPPDISMLPASNPARQSFERVATVMGPGWPTPYNVVVVSTSRPITARGLLTDIRDYQRRLADDPRVDSVVGPGAFVATSRDLKALPAGLEDSAKLLKGGKKELSKLARGLGEAGAGATQLQSGLGSAAEGAGKLGAGSDKAGTGAGKLRGGLDQARTGADKISAGLAGALAGARALKEGAGEALTGSQKLSGGLGQAADPVEKGLPVFRQLAADVKSSSGTVTAARGATDSSVAQLDAALAALGAMTAGKDDPRYAEAHQAVLAARGSASGAAGALATADPQLQGAATISAAAAGQVAELSTGLSRLYAGSKELSGGIAKLQAGNTKLALGIARLNAGGGQLTGGLTTLRDGAAALETGLAQLTGGAGQLQSGLAGGTGPAGQLAGGLGQAEAKVTKFQGDLPSPKELEELQKQSPGLFDSGYFVLAAIEGAPPADRALAAFAVNLGRGGNAGQIVIVPAQEAASEATRSLGEDLNASAARLAEATGTQVAVGGPAGDLADFTSETNARLPLVVLALALAVALVLGMALRAVALPIIVVAFDLLVAAASFGVLTLLFGGDDPLLGGPGYLDPMSIIGIFAAIFGISAVYQVLLLARTRERFTELGEARESLLHGLRASAAVATGAAAVMVAAVLPFAFGDLLNARQFAIGIAVAVTLDALIVRPVLLPAAVALLGRRAWWPTRGPSAETSPHQAPHHLDTGSPAMTAITTRHASVAWIALDAAERFGARPALTSPRGDPITYAELGTAVREIAGGLAGARGSSRGDHVAILCSTRPEWTLADYGILAAGATVVPIYPTNSPEECAYVLGHSESVAVICEDAEQLAKVERVRDGCPALATVVLMEGEAAGTVPLAELRRMGAGGCGRRHRAPARRRGAVGRRHHRLHLRHDGAAQGLRHHAREPPHHRHHVRARARARRGPLDVPVPAAGALARPHRPGRRAAGRRDAGLLGRRRQEDHRGGRAGRADALPLGPARVREDPHGRAERRGRAEPPAARRVRLGARGRAPVGGPTAQRQADGTPRPRAPRRGRPARAVEGARRVRRPAAARHDGSGPDRSRDPRVLRRVRRADPRGLRHVRVVRGRHAQHPAGRAARNGRPPAGRARRSRSPPTARC